LGGSGAQRRGLNLEKSRCFVFQQRANHLHMATYDNHFGMQGRAVLFELRPVQQSKQWTHR